MLGTVVLFGVVYFVVGCVKRVRRKWKEGRSERLDEGRRSCWRGCLGVGMVVSALARGLGKGQSRDLGEDVMEDGETRRLLV